MTETREHRLKRLSMRSWRRGTKEMDLILGPYADAHLAGMDDESLDAFEAFLAENDSDLYPWITGAQPLPPAHAPLIARLLAFAGARHG
ncbi:succinate dehydrogenase assembly factor 2 [Paracoccus sp. p3-h83]|uniref:succinate dehydrogenase assembly factor 2 n=1 Tax=Paracoccus sp. p3-h83 TaxID=3342805 RepID=UPI0035B81014